MKYHNYISTKKLNKIIKFDKNKITVESGALLIDILKFLQTKNLTLATIPEYLLVSAGACLFTPIHGSSNKYFLVSDIIESYTYFNRLDDKIYNKKLIKENFKTKSLENEIILNVTFNCCEKYYLKKKRYFITPEILYNKTHLENMINKYHSVVLHYYIFKKEILLWKTSISNILPKKTNIISNYAIRHTNIAYYINKCFTNEIIDINYKILGCCRNPPFDMNMNTNNMEFLIDFNDLKNVIKIMNNQIIVSNIGIRFSTSNYVWIDIVINKSKLKCFYDNVYYKIEKFILHTHNGKFRY
tara:strand:- start:126 stop:1025 length:900 start_codon:yes stop_codon:yes gene_type:complete